MNLFVATINPATTTKDLQKLFAHYGLVTTVKVILDHVTGKSKRYGFVEMPNNHEALEAIKELDKTSFQEYMITVKESQNSDYQIADDESEFENQNSTSLQSVNGDNRRYNNNVALLNKSQRSFNSPRNYGYRGSGYERYK